MSDTESMVRLIEHAATLLDSAQLVMQRSRGGAALTSEDVPRVVAAMANAQATLRMVAASVAPEGRSRVLDVCARIVGEYDEWADTHNEPAMTAGELAAMSRFLRSLPYLDELEGEAS